MPNYAMNRITLLTNSQDKVLEILKAIKNDEQLSHKSRAPEETEDEFIKRNPTIDLNKVVPMPKSLEISCGSTTDRGLDWWLWVNRRGELTGGKFPASKRLEPELSDEDYNKVLTYPRLSNVFDKIAEEGGAEKIEKYGDDKEIREIGIAAAHNIINYGVPTWYEWRNKNWSTKWNSVDAESSSSPNQINFTTAWSPAYKVVRELSRKYPDVPIAIQGADEFPPTVFPSILLINGDIINATEDENDCKLWGELWGYTEEEVNAMLYDDDDDNEEEN